MTWTEIIEEAKRQFEQSGQSPISDVQFKRYGCKCLREASLIAPDLFTVNRTFTSVASTAEYSFATYAGADIRGIYGVWFADAELDPMNEMAKAFPVSTGTPSYYYVRSDVLGLYPTPDSADTVRIFGRATPSRGAMTLIHRGTASATGATYAISAAKTLTLIVTGGTNAGTYTYDLTAAANDTISEIVAVINAAGKGFTAAAGDVPGTESSALLETVLTTSCYNTTTGAAPYTLFEDPAGRPWIHEMLLPGILMFAFGEDGQDRRYDKFKQEWEYTKARIRSEYRSIVTGYKNASIIDVSNVRMPQDELEARTGYRHHATL